MVVVLKRCLKDQSACATDMLISIGYLRPRRAPLALDDCT